MTLPPGPRGRLRNTWRYFRDPFGLLAQCARDYGDPFTLRTLQGAVVVTSDPAGIQALFTGDPDFLEPRNDLMKPLLGKNSLLIVGGARHKKDRKLLAPPFHGARMRTYGEIIREASLREAARWKPGEVFALQRSAQAISLQVILRAIFGVDDVERGRRIGAAISAVSKAGNPLLLFFPFLQHPLYRPWARFVEARSKLDALLYEEIEQHQRGGEDVLSLMLEARYDDGSGMAAEDVRDELLTLFFAGHESTALAIAWAFYLLHRHPEVRERLLAELDPGADDSPLLDAVCQETLRLYPLVPQVSRRLLRPLQLKGYELAAGLSAAAAVSLTHQREDLYPEPARFSPERFLQRKYSAFEFLPFGGGARRCIGAAFAQFEMKIVIATILREFHLRLASDDEILPVRSSITMGPAGGVPMILES
jgi:cytochrome P450